MGGKRTHRHGPPAVPVELPPHVEELLGPESGRLLHALLSPPPVSIRLNPLKPTDTDGAPVPWCDQGRYLEERPIFTLDPLLHAGAYYVQEASSMLLGQAFRACEALPADAVVLDLCAAPGGKSTHLAALLPETALLIANEPVRTRQAPLKENLWKWGRPDVAITGSAPEAFRSMGPFCDLVLVDAPCSGEGMFRKDPHARAQWGPHLVETCATRQEGILDAAWAALRPGGYLIYSTCTWEARENEDQVKRMMEQGAEAIGIAVDPAWGIEAASLGLRCYPHRVRGEGFFIAVLRKPVQADGERAQHEASRHVEACPPSAAFQGWFRAPDALAIMEDGELTYAVSKRWLGTVSALAASVQVLAPGLPIAQRKGSAWVPHPALALNALLDHHAFPTVEMDRAEVLRYLHGEAMPTEEAHGTVLMRYHGLGIGWANGAGKRLNNGWPAPWRIRMR